MVSAWLFRRIFIFFLLWYLPDTFLFIMRWDDKILSTPLAICLYCNKWSSCTHVWLLHALYCISFFLWCNKSVIVFLPPGYVQNLQCSLVFGHPAIISLSYDFHGLWQHFLLNVKKKEMQHTILLLFSRECIGKKDGGFYANADSLSQY